MTGPQQNSPKQLLERYGLKPKYSFGQNFLADERLSAKIAEACAAQGGTVIELGAGLGALTRPLLATWRSPRLVAVERDRDLVPALGQELAGELEGGRLEILEADAKSVDFVELFAGRPKPHVVAGNLPYQLTGPLLQKKPCTTRRASSAPWCFWCSSRSPTVWRAGPGGDAYGALSVFAQRAFKVGRAFVIRRGAFYPQPNVDSAVVTLEPLGSGPETDEFRAVVRGAFAQRRKQLKNAWAAAFGERGVELSGAAERAGIDLSLRGETLSVADFVRMAEELRR